MEKSTAGKSSPGKKGDTATKLLHVKENKLSTTESSNKTGEAEGAKLAY